MTDEKLKTIFCKPGKQMKKASKISFLLLALAIISSGIITESFAQTTSPVYSGISSIPRQQGRTSPYALSSIDEVISVMNAEHLNIWRMSFEPTFNEWRTFIQYYFDHCSYDLIVEPNHYYYQTLMSDSQWASGTSRCLEILEYFSDYQDRLWIEPQNEQLTDITYETQQFVNAVRGAGYTNNVVSNVFWRPTSITVAFQKMAQINDPLDKFWTGQHFYFDQISLSSAMNYMQDGLDLGLKMINTEIGADARETNYFDQSEVDDLNDFMQWCADRGVGNTVWLMYGDYDYPTYQNFDLEFPIIT